MRTRPYTLAEVTSLHETALSRQSPEALAAAGADLGALAAATALRHEQAGRLAQPVAEGLDGIENPAVRDSFEQTWDQAEQLFERISLVPPDPEQFETAGVDFARLANEYERMKDEGLEPEIVIAPQNLSLEDAKRLYAHLTDDTAIPNNPLKQQSDGNGLWVNDDVAAAWNTLVSTAPRDTDGIEPPHHLDNGGYAWTIRLIPGTDKPTDTNVDHATNDAVHPTMSEYLTLQATRIQTGRPPVDGSTYTWLNGTFGDGNGQAPRGRWDSGDGQVRVGWGGVGNRHDVLGSRLPVW